MSFQLSIRSMVADDPALLFAACASEGWDKPLTLFERYCQEQESGARELLIAEYAGQFAGYVTIVWGSEYPPFLEAGIPEINDFNVLKELRRRGIGSALLDVAEARIARRSAYAGIGVGVFADYGPAHILYVQRGYIPDGLGLYQAGRHCQFGDRLTVNHDLALWFTKPLSGKTANSRRMR